MKLLYITNGINAAGGLERVLSVKASYLAEKLNYHVTIITLNSENYELFYKFSSKIKFYNVNASGNSISYFISYKKGIKQALSQIKPDVISVCDDGLKGVLFPIIFGKKTPVIYERHASQQVMFDSHQLSFFKKIQTNLIFSLMQIGAKQFDKFVVLTKGNLQEWDTKNTMVIPNPMPFKSEDTSRLLNKKILAVGRQAFQKGYDILLKVWKIVEDKHPDWQLEIYGKQDKKLELDSLIKIEGVKSVKFFPPTKDIESKYKEASVFVMTSRSEGFGMVLIEAMNFGLPCVSFSCPHGPADIIKNEEDGFLVVKGHINSFAKNIIELIENYELRVKMGTKAKENVKRYAPDNVVPLWDELFKSLVK